MSGQRRAPPQAKGGGVAFGTQAVPITTPD
jgi:ribosomal protein L4